jgi:hypothetical protein
MKHKELKITKKMLNDGRYQGNSIYGVKKIYCDLHDCCEVCNPKIKLLCKVIQKIEDLQIKIIKRIVKD